MSFTFSHLEASVQKMAEIIRRQDFLTYFKKFSLMGASDTMVAIGVPSTFLKDNLSKKFYDDIKTAIKEQLPTLEVVDFIVDDRMDIRPDSEVIDCRVMLKKQEKQTKKEQVQ